MEWYLEALRKYAVMSGRARRKEYWMFTLIYILFAIGLGFVAGFIGLADEQGNSMLLNLYILAMLVPSLTVGVRRMHDTGRSGWWLLVPIVNFVFAVQDSEPGENRYGPNPKAA